MAKLTVKILGDNTEALKSIQIVQQKLDDLGRHPVEIKIDAIGNTDLLKQLTKLEQAKASAARANAKIVESENKVKIARAQTRTETAKAATEEKKAETAKRQATLETKKATTAEKQRQAAIERTTETEKKQALQEERTNTKKAESEVLDKKLQLSAERRAASEKKATDNTKELGEATEKTAKKTETLWDNFQKFARWYIIGNAFSGIVRSMKEALETMKAVDDELVTIRKVTGFSNEQIAGIQEQAYSTASKYGVGAADYLESVAAFSRAGYKEQAAALAELSTKTQIVGDTTAETANQFLLSVDAAYKYKGSIEQLTAVLDGANEIDNKYATSIEKIAEGMGIVAPVAEQMHVGVNELAASIGTITAVTQRSGSEAARALRALFLNIVGDTKTEIDEGVTWTTGEIAGLKDVIRQFAPEAYNAAQAMHTIIDPMEAIGGLAKSMQEGLLTEQKLMEMVSDIGGKLRTSQLLAIIQNWDMYQNMLTDYAGAIGSADKEVENALDSWTRKTNQLKNAWAEFVSHLIDSGEIKAGIDLMTGFVKALDGGAGKVVAYTAVIIALTAAMTKLVGAIKKVDTAFFSSPLFIAGVAVAAITGIISILDELYVTYDEHIEKLEELNAEYDKLYGAGGELADLKSRIGDLTEEELKRLGVLESQRKELERQIQLEKELAFDQWRKEQNVSYTTIDPQTGFDVRVEYNKTEQALESAKKALNELHNAMNQAPMTMGVYQNAIQKVVNSLHDQAEAIKKGKDVGKDLSPVEEALLALYEDLSYQIGQYTAETEKNTQAKQDNNDATEEAAAANETLQKAFEEVSSKGNLTYGTLEELDRLYPGLSKKIIDVNGNLTAEGKAALSTKAAFVDLVGSMISAATTTLSFSGQITALYELATAAGLAGDAISGIFSGLVGGPAFNEDGTLDVNSEKAYARAAQNPSRTTSTILKKIQDELKKTDYLNEGSGYAGGGGDQTDKELESLKDAVSYEKQRLSFLEASGASAEDQAEQMRKVQDALHDEAEYLRKIEGESTNVIALSTEWWNIQNKIAKLLENDTAESIADTVEPLKDIVALKKQELSFLEASGASEQDRIAKMREIQASLHDQAEEMRKSEAYINGEADALREVKALSTEWWSIQNDILELEDKIAQKLRDEIAQTLTDIVESLQSAADAMISPLQEQLDALNEAHNATEERREEEEKIAAVQEKQLALEKARIALENAQRERNVRQYNSRTNQWEWVANAKNVEAAQKDVETAQKNLVDAQNDLAKYYADQAYETAKENLEKQISNTRSAFDALKQAMEEAAQAIKDGKMSYQEAYAYIKQKMKGIYNEYGVDLTDVLDSSITEFGKVNTKIKTLLQNLSTSTQSAATSAASMLEGTADDITSGVGLFTQYIQNALDTYDPEQAIKELSDAIRNGIVTDLNDVESILRALNGDYAGISAATARLWALTKMQANSIAWHSAANQQTKDALHAENVQLGSAIGLTYNSTTGTWHDSTGKQVYTLNAIESAGAGSSGSSSGGGGSSGSSAGSSDGELASEEDRFYNNPNTSDYFKQAQVVSVETDDDGNAISYSVMANDGEMFTVTKDGEHSKLFQWVDWAATGNVPEQEVNRGHTEYHAQHKKDLTLSFLQKNDGTYAAIIHGSGSQTEGFEARFFDRGGILRGMGGIKATPYDEMVLPPSMTDGLLNAERNGSFDALLGHLGIITAAANGVAKNNIGSQHNGDVYTMNGVTIGDAQARSMTVYELAQMGKTLALHRGS